MPPETTPLRPVTSPTTFQLPPSVAVHEQVAFAEQHPLGRCGVRELHPDGDRDGCEVAAVLLHAGAVVRLDLRRGDRDRLDPLLQPGQGVGGRPAPLIGQAVRGVHVANGERPRVAGGHRRGCLVAVEVGLLRRTRRGGAAPELGDDEPPEQPAASATAASARHPILPTMQQIIDRSADGMSDDAIVKKRGLTPFFQWASAPTFSGWWQAATWPSPWSMSGGSSVAQISVA